MEENKSTVVVDDTPQVNNGISTILYSSLDDDGLVHVSIKRGTVNFVGVALIMAVVSCVVAVCIGLMELKLQVKETALIERRVADLERTSDRLSSETYDNWKYLKDAGFVAVDGKE